MSETVRRMKCNRVLADSACKACAQKLGFGTDIAVCAECEAPHHAECWDSANGCAFGLCGNAPLAQIPETAPVPAAADGTIVCKKCGTSYSVRRIECPQCRTKTPGAARAAARPIRRGGAPGATASLVFGILSLFVCGLIFGIMAISKANEAKRTIAANPHMTGGGKATAGRVLGIIGLVLWGLYILITVASR